MSWLVLTIFGGVGLLLVLGTVAVIATSYRRVEQGQALIVSGLRGEPRVARGGAMVYPLLQRAERIDLSVRKLVIERAGAHALSCRDNIRADVRAAFFLRVGGSAEEILQVARSVGSERASRPETLEELFAAKLADALASVARQLDFEQLLSERELFRDRVIEVIGRDLGGFVLDGVALERLEQTPLEALDPRNILDAQGIRKLLEIASRQGQAVSELVLQRFHEAQTGYAVAAGRLERPSTPAPSPGEQSAYRDARAAAERQVQVLEEELERARRTLAAYDRKPS